MYKKVFLFILILPLLLPSCSKPPVACMEISETSVPAGTVVEFTSCSERALSFEWFMDGPEGAPENEMGWSDEYFTNTFSVPGIYTVTLTAYSDFSFLGEKSTITGTVVIN